MKLKYFIQPFSIFCYFFFFATTAQAQVAEWAPTVATTLTSGVYDNLTDNSWYVAANWNFTSGSAPGGIPDENTDVIIPGGVPVCYIPDEFKVGSINTLPRAKSITIQSGGGLHNLAGKGLSQEALFLEIAGDLTVDAGGTYLGNTEETRVNGNFLNNGDFIIKLGTNVLEVGANFTNNSRISKEGSIINRRFNLDFRLGTNSTYTNNNGFGNTYTTFSTYNTSPGTNRFTNQDLFVTDAVDEMLITKTNEATVTNNDTGDPTPIYVGVVTANGDLEVANTGNLTIISGSLLIKDVVSTTTAVTTADGSLTHPRGYSWAIPDADINVRGNLTISDAGPLGSGNGASLDLFDTDATANNLSLHLGGDLFDENTEEPRNDADRRGFYIGVTTIITNTNATDGERPWLIFNGASNGSVNTQTIRGRYTLRNDAADELTEGAGMVLPYVVILDNDNLNGANDTDTNVELASGVRFVGDITIHKNTIFNLLSNKVLLGDNPDDELNAFGTLRAESNAEFRMHDDVRIRGRSGGSIIIQGSNGGPVFFSRGDTGNYRVMAYSGCYVSVIYGDFFAMVGNNDDSKGTLQGVNTGYALANTGVATDNTNGGTNSNGGLKVYQGATLDPVNNFSFGRMPNKLTLNMTIPIDATNAPEYNSTGFGGITIDGFFFGGGTGSTVVRNNINGAIIMTNALGNSAAAGVGEIYDRGDYSDPGDPDRIIWNTFTKCIWKGGASSGDVTSWNNPLNWINESGGALGFVPGSTGNTAVDVIIPKGADNDCNLDVNNINLEGTIRVNFAGTTFTGITGSANRTLNIVSGVTLFQVSGDFMIDDDGAISVHSDAAPNQCRIEVGGTINFDNNAVTFTEGTSVLACVGDQRQRVTLRGESLYTLEVASTKTGDVFCGGAVTLNGNLDVQGGLFRGNAGGADIRIRGDVVQTGGDIFPWNSDFFMEGSWLNTGGTMANAGNGSFNFEPGNTTAKQIRTNGQNFTTVNFNDNGLGAVTEYNLVDNWTILTILTIRNNCQLNVPDAVTANFGRTNINSGGTVDVKAGGTLAMEASETLTVNDGGKIKIIGESGKYARLTRQGSSGTYSFNITGTISARYYLIESLDANGVNLQTNAKTESPGTITYGGGGSGYTSAPTVTVAGGGGSGADFEAILTGDAVTSYTKRNTLSTVNIVSGGTGYPTDGNFPITVTGGTTNGSVIVTVNSGVITAASISSFGTGYTSTPTLDLTSLGAPTSPATVNLTISNAISGGSGFTQTPTVVLSGGGGTGATGSAQLTATPLDKVVIFSGGTGYNDGTHPYTVLGGSPNATVNFVVSGGVITNINVTSAGGGYTSTPTIDLNSVVGLGTPTTAASVDAYLIGTSVDQITIPSQLVYPVATFSDGIFTDGVDGGAFITIASNIFTFNRAGNDVYSRNATTALDGSRTYSSPLPAGVTHDYNTDPRIDTIYNIVFPKNPGSTAANIRRTTTNNNGYRRIIIKDALGTFSGEDFDDEAAVSTRAANNPNAIYNPDGIETDSMVVWRTEGVKRWDGGPTSTGTSWSDPQNWRPDGVPGPGDKVIISYDLLQLQWNVAAGPPDVIAPASFVIDFDLNPATQPITCRSLTIESSLPDPNATNATKPIVVNMQQNMTVLENVVISSDVTVNPSAGTTLSVGGSWNNDGDFNPTSSVMTVDFNQSFTRTVTNGGGSRFSNILFSQGITDLGSDLYVEGNLTIESGSSLSPSNNNRQITIEGNWINRGTFDPKQGTVQFGNGGSATQTVTKVPLNEPQEFYSVIVQKPTGILETGSRMQINQQLDIKNGKILTAKDKELIFGDNSNLPLVTSSSYIDGPCGHLYSDATTSANFKFFPIGKGDTYIGGSNANRRIQLSVRTTNLSIPAGQFLLMVMEQFEQPGPSRTVPSTSSANYVSRSRYWKVDQRLYPNTDSGPLQNGVTDVTIETAKIQLAFDASSERGDYTLGTNPWLFGTTVQEVDFAELGGLSILKDNGADKKGEGVSYPTVTITDNTPGSGATATATVGAGGTITGLTVVNGGSGYSNANPPLVTIGGGGDENGILNAQTTANNAGTGAVYTADVDGTGVITGFTLVSAGSGYNTDDPPVVTIGGTGAIGRAIVAGGEITSIEVIARGTGYKSPVVSITGVTSGTPADYNATVGTAGRITGFTQVDAGSGYVTGSAEWQDAGSDINNINSQQFTVESTGPSTTDFTFSTLGDGIFTLAWNFIALPIQFLELKADAIDNEKVAVKWVTNNEDEIARFEVQASRDGGKTFESIGERLGKGNGRGAINYEFMDNLPVDGINYYRLRQVDINGLERFTKVITANIDRPANFSVTPNPASKGQVIQIELSTITSGDQVVVKLLDIKGNMISSQEVSGTKVLDYKLPVNIAAGMYMLKLETTNKSYQSKIIVR
ncbi:MAG TPA: hypothetical protein DCS93_18310 [Microscillaceae bacterium]|nr:hypothetical protein [Microscillaceae bacterium]